MGIDQRFVAHETKPIADVRDGGAEILLSQLASAGEMTFDQPAEHTASTAPERKFRGLKMKIHRRFEIQLTVKQPRNAAMSFRS